MTERTTDIQIRNDFNQVLGIIDFHRQRVSKAVDDGSLRMIWEVGAYVSQKMKASGWGANVVRQLSEFIRTQNPKLKGWSYRTIYKMVQFYETYSSASFNQLIQEARLTKHLERKTESDDGQESTPIELAQMKQTEFVPFEMAQIPNILFSTGWTNHQIIMNRCQNYNERLFYMLYAEKEHLMNKQLERAIKTDTMSSILGAKDKQSVQLHDTYSQSPMLFKDTAYLIL